MSNETVSIVMATYDRARTLGRAIDSVLRQDHPLWQLIVVDDGSTDATGEVLAGYDDPRILIVRHERNKGVTAAKNTGLDHVTGEWFTFVDSDDEILPDGLSAMLAVADAHSDVTAVSCNCRDYRTGEVTGFGLDREGYVDAAMVAQSTGAHWGITRTALLGSLRFDERIPGFEGILWLKISASATRYYLDRSLKIYHQEDGDRVSVSNAPRKRSDRMYLLAGEDEEYLRLLSWLDAERYAATLSAVVQAAVASGERGRAWRFWWLYRGPLPRRVFLLSVCLLGPRWLTAARAIMRRLRPSPASAH